MRYAKRTSYARRRPASKAPSSRTRRSSRYGLLDRKRPVARRTRAVARPASRGGVIRIEVVQAPPAKLDNPLLSAMQAAQKTLMPRKAKL